MDKRVIFAVAGSGKTTRIVEKLDLTRRVLLLTYTDNNYAHLRQRIVEKFGFFPQNITLQTYFTFLHSFCYRPLLQMQLKTRGIRFIAPPETSSRLPVTNNARFFDGHKKLYHNRLAKLLDVKSCMPEVLARIERYFDALFVDEVQDFAGYDFSFLLAICKGNIDVMLVGDFYQHTFDTSRDGSANKNLHDNLEQYERRFTQQKIILDKSSLLKSRRCGKDVCSFIREHLQIDIQSHDGHETAVSKIESQFVSDEIYANQSVVKLFYKEHYKYNCYSQNWGASKGLDHFKDVCVVMNPNTWKLYQQGELHKLSAVTRNKLYVACSRARGNLTFVPESLFKKHRAS